MIVMFALIIAMLLAIVVSFIYLCYWILKKIGYPIAGKIFSLILSLGFATFLCMLVFEDELFSKNDARALLKEQEIDLIDKFEILDNETMSGIGDYYHRFTLKISENDKRRLVKEIEMSENFTPKNIMHENHNKPRSTDYNNKKEVTNYKTTTGYVRELYELQEKGYAPKWRRVEIDKKANTLVFEDITN